MPLREMIPELWEKARTEINEDPDRVQQDIEYIKEWLRKQPHLKARMDDQWILAFLRGCKFSLERTKEKIDYFYTVRSMIPEFFVDRDPKRPEIRELIKKGVILILPRNDDPYEPTIVFGRAACFDPEKIKFTDLFKVNMMFMDLILLDDDFAPINGMHFVQDMENVTLAHMAPLAITKKAMTIFQHGYPNRPKGMHSFNLPNFFETIYDLFKPFLTEKMKNRMNLYTGGIEDLFKKLSKERFPKDYGGNGPSIEELIEMNLKKLDEYRDWFLEDSKYGVDESKRPGKPKSADELFGIEGSFRKLTVD